MAALVKAFQFKVGMRPPVSQMSATASLAPVSPVMVFVVGAVLSTVNEKPSLKAGVLRRKDIGTDRESDRS